MQIKQWEDKNLSHFSYAILSECEKKIVLIDPARDPRQYYAYAQQQGAAIVGIIETHLHADFASAHREIGEYTGAPIYFSKEARSAVAHVTFNADDPLIIGEIKLTAIDTPGHSPDSICVLLEHDNMQKAIFTGDTLFVGDCGRPDLREDSGEVASQKEMLAKQMYHSLRNRLAVLNDETVVYPAHGAGTLCGKSLSDAQSSTVGQEKMNNWSLQEMTETEFVQQLLSDQSFIPAYFPYDVELNRVGARAFKNSVESVPVEEESSASLARGALHSPIWLIDTRQEREYKKHHYPASINLMEDGKFETWLGTLIHPEEKFYLGGSSPEQLQRMIARCGSIGYEAFIESAFVVHNGPLRSMKIDLDLFKENTNAFTIVDVRGADEVEEHKIFRQSISIPLNELRNRINEIPLDKPIVVHCAGGYRSAAASSLIRSIIPMEIAVFDLGESIKQFE